MRKDRFTDEALKAAYALAELKYSEDPEDQQAFVEAFAIAFAEAYDFARCQRPDGSFYGTSGQCRKGKEAGAKPEEPKKARAAKPAEPKAPKAAKPKVGDREKLLMLRSKRDNLKANLEKDGAGNPMVRRILNEEIAKTNKQIDRVKKKVPKTPQAEALNKARNEVQSRFNKMAEELKKAEGKEFYRIQGKMRNMINTMERISNTYRKMAKAGRDV